ncbi:MAG: hypothetical protein EPO11_10985 [Gammaproteobacteria bacterium]|nr:MAG: hypothetical protein EPO11_10985 [Gammaproteobacteria bacterium]
MSRKKTAKNAAKHLSRVNTQQWEKDFLKMPVKLAKKLKKEISLAAKKENKLAKTLNKLKTQLKTTETQMKAAEKNAYTSTGKKQYKAAKKMHKGLVKTQKIASKQLEAATQSVEKLTGTQDKLHALHHHLTQFEKEWAKETKSNKKTKMKAKPASRTKTKKVSNKAVASVMQEPAMESFETIMENTRLNEHEPAEMTS